METTRQWAVGQLVQTGHQVKNEEGKLVPEKLLILGADNSLYFGALVYVDEQGKVATLSIKFYYTYSGLSVQPTRLQYTYTSIDQARGDLGIFKPYFSSVAGAEN